LRRRTRRGSSGAPTVASRPADWSWSRSSSSASCVTSESWNCAERTRIAPRRGHWGADRLDRSRLSHKGASEQALRARRSGPRAAERDNVASRGERTTDDSELFRSPPLERIQRARQSVCHHCGRRAIYPILGCGADRAGPCRYTSRR
jgi:hypothetical protein